MIWCHSKFHEVRKSEVAHGLNKKRFLKKYDKVMVKIGRLRQKYSRVSRQYTISVEQDEKSGNASKISWQQQLASDTTVTYPGV